MKRGKTWSMSIATGELPLYVRDDEKEPATCGVTFNISIQAPQDPEETKIVHRSLVLMGKAALLAYCCIDSNFLRKLERESRRRIPLASLLEMRTAVAHYYLFFLYDQTCSSEKKQLRRRQLRTLNGLDDKVAKVKRDFGRQADVFLAAHALFSSEQRTIPRRLHNLDRLIIDLAAACEPMIGRRAYSPTGPFAQVLRVVWSILPIEDRSKSGDAFASRAGRLRPYFAARRRVYLGGSHSKQIGKRDT